MPLLRNSPKPPCLAIRRGSRILKGAPPAWSVLQSAGVSTGSSATSAASFGGNLSSGTKILAWVGANTAPTTVKDTANNSLTQVWASTGNVFGGNGTMTVWAMDTPAGDVGATTTITATGAAGNFWGMVIQEVSGLLAGATSAILDGTPGQNGSDVFGTTGSHTTTSPAYSSAAAGEYLAGFYADGGGTGTGVSAATGYTVDAHSVTNTVNVDNFVAYKSSTGGAESIAFTFTSNPITGSVALLAFKLAAAGAAPALPDVAMAPMTGA